jgi:hypothetical protein
VIYRWQNQVSNISNQTLVEINTSHTSPPPITLLLDESLEVRDYDEVTHQQTLHAVSKRSPPSNKTAEAEFLKPIKHVVTAILSMYHTYKSEVQLITCATEYFNTRIRNLLQQDADQGVRVPKHTGSRLARGPYNISHTENRNVGNFKTVTDTRAYSAMKNLKHYDKNCTGRNIESLEGMMYQAVRECLVVAEDLVPGLRTLMQVLYTAWNWGVQLAEFVNRNKLALCIRKFTEKKFWVWIETNKYE